MTQEKRNANAPILAPDTIDIWTIRLKADDDRLASYRKILAPRERDRADRLRFDDGRHRYTVGRGAMRTVLSRYLKIEPASVGFTYGAHGKPAMANRQTGNDIGAGIEFNLSHSHEMAILAVNASHPVGIDIENLRDTVEHAALADRFFSAREVQSIRDLPAAQHLEAFFVIWTRKEAWLKAHGKGISVSLASFDVSAQLSNGLSDGLSNGLSNGLSSGPSAVRCDPNWSKVDIDHSHEAHHDEAASAGLWFHADLCAPAGYVAALSTDRATASIRLFQFD